MRNALLGPVLAIAGIAFVTAPLLLQAGCSSDDEAAEEREAKYQAALAKAAKRNAATAPDLKAAKPKKVPSRETLIASCDADDGAACQGACALGQAESCVKLGTLFEEGRGGVPENFDSARVFHRKGCELGAGSGCYAMGLFYRMGKSVPRNLKSAQHYFEKGCKVEFEPACAELEAKKKRGKKKRGKN